MDWRPVAEEMGAALDRPPVIAAPADAVSDALPPPLRAVYAECDGAALPVGTLYPQQTTVGRMDTPPFAPDWVAFGEDGRGTFWLCAREPADGLWFTAWDHDSGAEIGGPVWAGLGDLLRETFSEMLEARSEGVRLVVEDVPSAARMDVVRALKPFVSSGSAETLRMLNALPLAVPTEDAPAAYAAMLRLRTAGVRCHLQIDWL